MLPREMLLWCCAAMCSAASAGPVCCCAHGDRFAARPGAVAGPSRPCVVYEANMAVEDRREVVCGMCFIRALEDEALFGLLDRDEAGRAYMFVPGGARGDGARRLAGPAVYVARRVGENGLKLFPPQSSAGEMAEYASARRADAQAIRADRLHFRISRKSRGGLEDPLSTENARTGTAARREAAAVQRSSGSGEDAGSRSRGPGRRRRWRAMALWSAAAGSALGLLLGAAGLCLRRPGSSGASEAPSSSCGRSCEPARER